jgi:hypothetical protein
MIGSDAQWTRYIHHTCDDYDANMPVGKDYTPILIDGVRIPRPTSLRQVKKRELFNEIPLEIKESSDKVAASVDLEKMLNEIIKMYNIPEMQFAVQISADGALMGLGTRTSVTIKIVGATFQRWSEAGQVWVPMTQQELSPKSVFTVTMLKGEDKYSILEAHIERLASAFEKICKDGLETPQGKRKILGKGGGDLKFINGSFGLAGCSATCPCAWCIKKRAEFADDTIGSARTWAQIEELAHAAPLPFTCPGCKNHFKTDDEVDDYDDSNPTRFQRDHYGVKPGHCPLLHLIRDRRFHHG